MIDITCANCGKIVQKQLREYKRQIKSGQIRFYCNNICSAIVHNKEHHQKGNYISLQRFLWKSDEFSPFRKFISHIKYRSSIKKKHSYDVTVEYLKQCWEQQNGICPFTGWNLILPKDSNVGFESSNPMNASLDRIDNSKGYVEGNVRFVAYMANLARQSFTDEQLIEFCKAVSNEK